ncbi:Transcription factor stp1 [Castilleja foliolosa]|uniref:Transcription factor stp1 n=1 Tax=Castilleja foliolosa TaxID=1961234 RepID=A0ABD3EAY1_9LAMI
MRGCCIGPGSGPEKKYSGKLTIYVMVASVIALMNGFIYGLDIGLSGGVTSMDPFLEKFFPSVYRKQQGNVSTNMYCKFDSVTLTMFTSSLYLASLVSSVVASMVTRSLGRKPSMLLGGLLFCAGSLLSSLAQSLWMVIGGRIFLGLGIGFCNQSVPLYLSEVTPSNYTGALNVGFQLSITIGILAANILNCIFAKLKNGWRYSLGAALVPALIITVGSLSLPETPNSLIERGNLDKAHEHLKIFRGSTDVNQELRDLVSAREASLKIKHSWQDLFRREYRPYLTMAIAIPFFQQLTGINVIMFYAPVLYEMVGFGSRSSLIAAAVTGSVNFSATVVSIFGEVKWGRRVLFIEGGIQMLICQIVVSILIGVKFGVDRNPVELPEWYALVVVFFICIYVAGFAWSWGPLDWLLPGEIFPLEIKSAAQNLKVCVNMSFTFIVAQFFLPMLCHLKFGLFLFFGFFVAVMTIFIYLFLPETKNNSREEIMAVWKKHPYWSRIMKEEDDPSNCAASVMEGQGE